MNRNLVKTASLIISGVMMTLTLAACSGSPSTSANPYASVDPSTSASASVSPPTSQSPETSQSPQTPEASTSDSSGTRTVQTAKGEVEIPASPSRIADASGVSDILYILGIKPEATADSDAYDYTKFPVYLEKELAGSKIIGYPMMDTVDIEGVLSVEPDLIIINPRQEKAYEQLSAIATTIVIEPNVNDWRSDLRMVAAIFDKNDAAEAYIADYDKRVKEIGAKIKAANGEAATYFSFLTGGDKYYLFTGAAYGDILYNDMGLAAPEKLPEQDSITLPVATLEGLSEINADYMIILASEEDKAALTGSSVFNSLEAMKNDHVIWLTQSPYFNQAYSTYGKGKLIDEIETMLTAK